MAQEDDKDNVQQNGSVKLNFCFPLNLEKLQNEWMSLVPLNVDFDNLSAKYINETLKHPEVFKYLPYGPFNNQEEYNAWYYHEVSRPGRDAVKFAIILKAGEVKKRKQDTTEFETFVVEDGTFAGVTGLLNADPVHSSVGIGHGVMKGYTLQGRQFLTAENSTQVTVLPRFQRTFVGSMAHSLILHHLLDGPPEGLNVRRVQWQANVNNKASIAAAQRLGFQIEGIIRWQRALPEGKKEGTIGKETAERLPPQDPTGERKLGPGRHTLLLGLCWDDWQNGGREQLGQTLRRYAEGQ